MHETRTGEPALPRRSSRAGNGTRTRDPNLGKVVLYQLSYSRVLTSISGALGTDKRRYFASKNGRDRHDIITTTSIVMA